MSQTRAERLKQRKAANREKARIKRSNIQRNLTPAKWQLDVCHQGKWVVGFKKFRKWEHAQAYVDEVETARKAGAEIIPGRIVNLQTGKTVVEIAPSSAKPEGKGALPDKLAGKPEAAKKGILSSIFGRRNRESEQQKDSSVQNSESAVQ